MSLAVIFLAGPASAQLLGTTARQLPKGSLKILTYYQGVQDQALNFNVVGTRVCTAAPPSGAVTFGCGQGGDVEVKGDGGAAMLKVVYQPWESLQYYAAFGMGDYSMSVPSSTVVNRVTGDRPGTIMTVGLKAVLYPDTQFTPAIAFDASISRSSYRFNRTFPGGIPGVKGNIDQRLELMQYQFAVATSHTFTLKDADEKADEKDGPAISLKSSGFKLEPYGGIKWTRVQADLKDLVDGGHSGGKQDSVSPFLGMRIPFSKNEGLFAEASFVDGYHYGAGLEVRFK